MSDEMTLLPCPFCGGEAAIVPTLETTVREWFVTCSNLECSVLACRTKRYYTEAEAIAAWNARSTYGTLKAEQVMKIASRHQPDYCSDTHVCFDWQAIADELNAELGSGNCARCAEDMGRYADSLCDPLKERIAELLRCLENDWHIKASWDGLRKFWCVELTEEGVKLRDAYDEALHRIAALEELVWFMVPFFDSAISHECGCPDGYFEPHGCDDGCKALKELDERTKELGIEVDR